MRYSNGRLNIRTWDYNVAWDMPEWGILIAWNRSAIQITWKRLSDCVEWWAEFLYVERGRVVVQYRFHSLKSYPECLPIHVTWGLVQVVPGERYL